MPDQSYSALNPEYSSNLKICLRSAVRQHLPKLGTARVVVRVYASLSKLENDLLCPLQQFAVLFSSLDPFFDFVNVRDEAMVERKIAGELYDCHMHAIR